MCFRSHASAIDHVLANLSFHATFGGGWPIASLLVHVRKAVRRHRFQLEFREGELGMRHFGFGHQRQLEKDGKNEEEGDIFSEDGKNEEGLLQEQSSSGRKTSESAASVCRYLTTGPRGEPRGDHEDEPRGEQEPRGAAAHLRQALKARYPAWQGDFSPAFGSLLREVLACDGDAAPTASTLHTPVLTSMVYGAQFSPYVANFLRRVFAVGVDHFVLFTADEESETSCRQVQKELAVSSSGSSTKKYKGARVEDQPPPPVGADLQGVNVVRPPQGDRAPPQGDRPPQGQGDRSSVLLCVRLQRRSIMGKFEIPLILLNLGYLAVLWVDFDVYFFQDPVRWILRQSGPVEGSSSSTGASRGAVSQLPDVLISGSFLTHCVTSAIVWFTNRRTTRLWLLAATRWMYTHPYEHDQKCVSAFLPEAHQVRRIACLRM